MKQTVTLLIFFFLGIYLVFAFEKQQWAPEQLYFILHRFEWSTLDKFVNFLFILIILNVQDGAGNSSVYIQYLLSVTDELLCVYIRISWDLCL